MKKHLIISFFILFLATNASALSLQWNLNVAGFPGTGDGYTSIFNEIKIAGASLISQNDTDGSSDLSVGDMFTEDLIFRVTTFEPGMADDEGINDSGGYEITGYFHDIVGVITNITSLGPSLPGYSIEYELLSATLDMYIGTTETPQDAYAEITLANGTTTSSIDASNYTNGTKIASATLLKGAGNTWVDPSGSKVYDQGSTNIDLLFDRNEFLTGFWLDENGVDIATYDSFYYFLAFPAVDLDDTKVSAATNTTGDLFDAKQSNDGSSSFAAVPEPSTMMLFGLGLLSLAGISRKKIKKD